MDRCVAEIRALATCGLSRSCPHLRFSKPLQKRKGELLPRRSGTFTVKPRDGLRQATRRKVGVRPKCMQTARGEKVMFTASKGRAALLCFFLALAGATPTTQSQDNDCPRLDGYSLPGDLSYRDCMHSDLGAPVTIEGPEHLDNHPETGLPPGTHGIERHWLERSLHLACRSSRRGEPGHPVGHVRWDRLRCLHGDGHGVAASFSCRDIPVLSSMKTRLKEARGAGQMLSRSMLRFFSTAKWRTSFR